MMSRDPLDLVNPDKESQPKTTVTLEDVENESVSLLISDQMKILKDEVKKELDKQKGDYEIKMKELKDNYDDKLENQGRKIKKLQEGGNEEEEEEEEDTKKLPPDTFSFFICSKPKSVAFCFACLVFAIQLAVFALLLVNRITPRSDNPLNIPDCVDIEVLVTQVIAIVISVYIQDDLRVAFEQFFPGYSEDMEKAFQQQGDQQGQHDISRWKWGLSHTCRFLEGLFGLVISFFLIIAVDNVFDLLLNFTAMVFVSEFDDIAFKLSSSGYFGASIKKKTQIIDQTSYKVSEEAPNQRTSWYHYIITHANIIMLCLAMTGMLSAWYAKKPDSPASKCLCTFVYAQFGDNALPELGQKSGIYVKKGHRRDYKNSRAQYVGVVSNSSDVFSYSNEWEAWTFCEKGNDCGNDNWKARSFQTSSIDLVSSTSATTWIAKNEIQLDYFRLSCIDDDIELHFDSLEIENVTKQLQSECENDTYGPFCSKQEPCKTIELERATKGFTDPDPNSDSIWSKNYEVLHHENISVQSHGHTVYVGEDGEANYTDAIYFTGRRWAFSHTNKTPSELTAHFGRGFQASAQDKLEIHFNSASVDIISMNATISPASLSWFYNKNMTGSRFTSPDFERPVDAQLFCSFCNNNANPCQYEGHCNSDGTCTCKHDADGSLCLDLPTGNGKCDPYFNEVEFDFDGGDCCGATCQDSTLHVCGIGVLQSAFGVKLTRAADGFQECEDTSMVPITIELCIPIYISAFNDKYSRKHDDHGAVSLVCDNVTYLYLPPTAFPEDTVDDHCMNETVRVKDGTECNFFSTAALNEFDDFYDDFCDDFYDQHSYKIYDNVGSVLVQSVGNQSLSSSFSVISSCLLAKLSNITNQTVLEDKSTAQGKAIRWLNTDKSQFSQCQSNFLNQRYVLASLDFTLNEEITTWSSWLSSDNECRWNSDVIGCNQDSFISLIDLGKNFSKTHVPKCLAGA